MKLILKKFSKVGIKFRVLIPFIHNLKLDVFPSFFVLMMPSSRAFILSLWNCTLRKFSLSLFLHQSIIATRYRSKLAHFFLETSMAVSQGTIYPPKFLSFLHCPLSKQNFLSHYALHYLDYSKPKRTLTGNALFFSFKRLLSG